MAKRRVSMQDIADELGIHQSSVSRALADHPQTAAAVKDAVHACARRLGYRQDPGLRALAQARWLAQPAAPGCPIAIVSAAPNTAIRSYLRGHQRKTPLGRLAGKLGYRLEYHELDACADPAALGDELQRRGVRGIIFGAMAGYRSLDELPWPWERFYLAAADVWWDRLAVPTLLPDYEQAVALAWQHMLAAGIARPGLALQRRGRIWEEEVLAAWNQQALRHEVACAPSLRFWPEERPDALVDWCRRERPDCVVGSHSGVYWDLIDAGIDVPRALQVLSLSLSDRRRWVAGCQLPVDLSQEALRLIDRQLRAGEQGRPEHVYSIRYDYIWRDGTSFG